MPVQKEGAHQHEDQEHLALVFAQAVRDVCFTSTDMRLNAIGEIIGEYVRENPHNDVLNRTRDLFYDTESHSYRGLLCWTHQSGERRYKRLNTGLLFLL